MTADLLQLILNVDKLRRQTKKRFNQMTVELEDLKSAVAENEAATATAISRLLDISAKLDDLIARQVPAEELQALADQVRADNAELIAAATPPAVEPEPTPEEPVPEEPVPEEPVA